DETGRLVRIVNADGNAIQIDRPDSAVEKITDLLGNTTTYVRDDQGNVITLIDAEGGVTRRTYDDSNHLLTETVVLEDGTELTTRQTLDSLGRVLTWTNPAGESWSYTYDAAGRQLTATDPAGTTQYLTYDARGNLLTYTDEKGHVTHNTYNNLGDLLTTTDPLGQTFTIAYDLFGRSTSAEDPAGRQWGGSFDLNGRELSGGYLWVNPRDPSDTQVVLEQNFYDREGRPTRHVNADGTEQSGEYDAAGNLTRFTDTLGNTSTYLNDLN